MTVRINKKKMGGPKATKKLSEKDAREAIGMAAKLAIRQHRKALKELEKY
jgi:hypothetical protein